MNTIDMVEGVLRDVRHVLRMLRRNPALSIAAVLSLALGIGAATTIFSMVNGILIRPLPYPDSDHLIGVFASGVIQGRALNAELSPGMFAALRRSGPQLFEQFGVWSSGTATVTGIGEPEEISVVTLTQGVLPALAVEPLLGRWFSKEDDSPGSPSTAILSHRYWQRKFGGTKEITGRIVAIESRASAGCRGDAPKLSIPGSRPGCHFPQRFPSSGLKPAFSTIPVLRG